MKKEFWIKVLNKASLAVRRRASAYLDSVRKVSSNEWVVESGEGVCYSVRLRGNDVVCTCPYYALEKGYCKHICAVAVQELALIEVYPWLKKLKERS